MGGNYSIERTLFPLTSTDY